MDVDDKTKEEATAEFSAVPGHETDDTKNQATVADEIEALQQRLCAAEEQADKYRNLSLRAKADAENAIKRVAREIEKVRKYAGENIIVRLFEVKDNLERSLQNQADNVTAADIQKGVELTLKSLVQVFTDCKVEEINPVKQSFNPDLHQAVSTVETDELPANTVVDILQKGYCLDQRLLRPALVVVAAAVNREEAEQSTVPDSDFAQKDEE